MTDHSLDPAALDGIAQPPPAVGDLLATIQGQLTDLPRISAHLADTRLDLRQDIRALRNQMADLPGIRTRLEQHTHSLAQITTLLTTIITVLRPGSGTAEGDSPEGDP